MRILRYILSIVFVGLFFVVSSGQETSEKAGSISYKSSQNVYVRFESTEGMEKGDTLYVNRDGKMIAALVIENLSSISCVCSPIVNMEFSLSDKVFFRPGIILGEEVIDANQNKAEEVVETPSETKLTLDDEVEEDPKESKMKRINGRVSVSSYSDFSNTDQENSQRMRYVLSLNAEKIGGSKVSFETYTAFSHRNNEWDEIQNNVYNGLKIYNLALNYEFNQETKLWFGRRINPKVSSLGAIDGLQFEKKFNSITAGAVVGSHPDWHDYSFNTELFQSGLYVSHEFAKSKLNMQSTLAFVDQENNWNTDRRFIYLQHTSRLFRKIYFFGSGEIDLYEKVNEQQKSTFKLSNLYLRLRYRMSRQLSLSFSYSVRNNIILYETYKSFIEELLERETLQGYTLSANLRPFKNVSIGARAGYRDRGGDQRPSKNLYTYLSFTRLPFLQLSTTINAIFLETAYLKGRVYGIRIYRDLLKGKLYASAGYKRISYTYYQNEFEQLQDIAEISMNFRLPWNLYSSLNYEGTFDKEFTFSRVYLNLTKRF